LPSTRAITATVAEIDAPGCRSTLAQDVLDASP
jgi:hypothetical protein